MARSASKVYLAGPITGLSYEGAAKGWREEFADKLALRYDRGDVMLYSPMRGKEFLKGQEKLPDQGFEHHPISTAKAILGRDFADVASSDLVVMGLHESQAVSIGSMIELGFAHALRKPVLLIRDKKNIYTTHAWIKEIATWEVQSVDSALDIALAFLNPGL